MYERPSITCSMHVDLNSHVSHISGGVGKDLHIYGICNNKTDQQPQPGI